MRWRGLFLMLCVAGEGLAAEIFLVAEYSPKPIYPNALHRAGVTGDVRVSLTVHADGSVSIHQDARMYVGLFDGSEKGELRLADGRLVRLMSDCELDPDAFGAHILAVYPSHRRATHKVQVFIQFLEAFLRERGYA